jgi:hypothetical protein
MFTFILALEEFTGGGGNADKNADDSESESEKDLTARKISLAQECGVALGSLTLKMYDKWQSNGWYDLFFNW